jgi:G:T-mismatch repair DNA endonuclease (very short patch repair protein)
MPASRVSYWRPKIERNLKRDRQVRGQLARSGWRVIRVWEHQVTVLSLLRRVLEKIRYVLEEPVASARVGAAWGRRAPCRRPRRPMHRA